MKNNLLNHTILSRCISIYKKNFIRRKKKPEESGRSMVEMLGVLAVIGVISIGGIWGYRLAMTKYRANETLDELNKRANVYLSVLNRTGTIGADEFGNTTRLGYPITLNWDSTVSPMLLEIGIGGLEKGVCRELINASWPLPIQMLIGESEASSDLCADAKTKGLTVVFETEGGSTNGTEDSDEDPSQEKACNGRGEEWWCGCYCNPGYSGNNCEKDESCNGHGEYQEWESMCICNAGWYGLYCTEKEPEKACNNHGEWTECGCRCDTGWVGLTCSIDERKICNNHGTYKVCGGSCQCDSGWCGTYCTMGKDICNNHGTHFCGCGCQCDAGWCGTYCTIGADNCSGNGMGDVFCSCNEGFGGLDCSQDKREACNNHGEWSWISQFCGCNCDPGWTGLTCSVKEDDREKCNNHGHMSGNFCVCDPGWGGYWCDIDNQEICHGHGTYDSNQGSCICDSGWIGSTCASPEKEEEALNCKNGVRCGDFCSCDAGYGGKDCSISARKICHFNGIWSSWGRSCNCEYGWMGADCSIRQW